MTKGLSLLQVLFVVFLTLHLLTFQPFAGWSIWKISLFLIADYFLRFLHKLWFDWELDKTVRVEIDRFRYNKIILQREIKKAQLEAKKQIDARELERTKNKGNA